MTIKQSGTGDDSAWEMWVGDSRRRLFVWRKLGGKDSARVIAEAEEKAMKAAQPKLRDRVVSAFRGFLR